MNEICFEIEKIPKGWIKTSISQISEVIMGQSPPSTTYNQDGLGLPFFQGKSEFTSLHPIVKKWCSVPKKIALKDDILMSVRAPVGNTNVADRECCIGRGLAAIRYRYNYKFLYYFFRLIENKLDEKGTGTTFRSISADVVKNVQLFLPPLKEQNRIVTKIEELFSSLDKGIESLKNAQQQLKIYRQAVLKYAFEGKLTNKNVNRELPEGWKWFKLGDVADKQSIKILPTKMPDAIFIGMDCIEPHSLKPSYTYKFSEFKSAGNYFMKDQVLYGRMRPYLNKVYKAEFNGACSGEFIVLKCKEDFNPDLLKYIIHSKEFVRFANSKTSGDRPRISYDEIADFPIAKPPIEEQNKIVKEIESRLSVCDKIEESINQGLQQSEALRQSILKKAFKGQLVPQDSNDPPASELLEKIKAEKEKLKNSRDLGKAQKRK
ncbi:MAG: restriction endonuclease subunit S [Bacteroidetes bacterium]|nr:restriction endonuclease subunit S [Bacteroidota bacterium]